MLEFPVHHSKSSHCLTTKEDGGGSVIATFHDFICHAKQYKAEDIAALVCNLINNHVAEMQHLDELYAKCVEDAKNGPWPEYTGDGK